MLFVSQWCWKRPYVSEQWSWPQWKSYYNLKTGSEGESCVCHLESGMKRKEKRNHKNVLSRKVQYVQRCWANVWIQKAGSAETYRWQTFIDSLVLPSCEILQVAEEQNLHCSTCSHFALSFSFWNFFIFVITLTKHYFLEFISLLDCSF